MNRYAKISASRICCGYGECISSIPCKGEKKEAPLPQVGVMQSCPLEKYGMPDERYKPKNLEDSLSERPSLRGIASICKDCEHDRETDFMECCIDCPVYMAEENILEAMAEAACNF